VQHIFHCYGLRIRWIITGNNPQALVRYCPVVPKPMCDGAPATILDKTSTLPPLTIITRNNAAGHPLIPVGVRKLRLNSGMMRGNQPTGGAALQLKTDVTVAQGVSPRSYAGLEGAPVGMSRSLGCGQDKKSNNTCPLWEGNTKLSMQHARANKPPAKTRQKLMKKEVSMVLILFGIELTVRGKINLGPQPLK
jgi:hypothetical protein